MNKRAQMTIFLIIAVLVVSSILFLVYINSRNVETTLAPSLTSTENIPLEAQPVKLFIENCLSDKLKEAIKKLGNRGGYIKIPSYMTVNQDPTESDAVIFSKDSSLVVPYWFYLKDPNLCTKNCEFSLSVPKLTEGKESFKAQIEGYIEDNMEECLDFSSFTVEGIEIDTDDKPEATVYIAEDDVTAKLNQEFKIKEGDDSYKITEFFADHNVKLKDAYDLAKYLAENEYKYRFLEKDTINLISGFAGMDEDKLPPMTATKVGINKKITWEKREVKKRVDDMISSNIPLLKVENTENYYEYDFSDPVLDGLYNLGMTIPNNKTYDLKTEFSYLNFWNMFFDISCGEICKPESMIIDLLGPFGFDKYEFAYDLSYPVKVSLEDETAFNGEGFTLNFFLESNVRNNKAMYADFSPVKRIDISEESQLCDINKRNSGEIVFTISDSLNNKAVDDVAVHYTCADETCSIGSSKNGILVEKLPICLNGYLTFVRQGYLQHVQPLTTELDSTSSVDVKLTPILPVQLDVKRKKLVKNEDEWQLNDNELGLMKDHEAMIIFSRIMDDGTLKDEQIAAQDSTIELAPGNYNINAQLFLNETLVIPEREECQDVLLTEKCYTIEEAKLEAPFMTGGLNINVTITPQQLVSGKLGITLLEIDYAGTPPNMLKVEDVSEIANIEKYSNIYYNSLLPR